MVYLCLCCLYAHCIFCICLDLVIVVLTLYEICCYLAAASRISDERLTDPLIGPCLGDELRVRSDVKQIYATPSGNCLRKRGSAGRKCVGILGINSLVAYSLRQERDKCISEFWCEAILRVWRLLSDNRPSSLNTPNQRHEHQPLPFPFSFHLLPPRVC